MDIYIKAIFSSELWTNWFVEDATKLQQLRVWLFMLFWFLSLIFLFINLWWTISFLYTMILVCCFEYDYQNSKKK